MNTPTTAPHDDYLLSQNWTAQHQAEITAWLETQDIADAIEHDTARFAAAALVSVPEMRGVGRVLGEPVREALCWDEIDAYEILFQFVVHGGPMDGWSEAAYLRFMGSFASFLGERGIIPAHEHAKLECEFPIWADRLLEVWHQGGWYERSGRHIAPAELRQRDEFLASTKPRKARAKGKSKNKKGQKTGARIWHRR